jgi:hypothetical protein
MTPIEKLNAFNQLLADAGAHCLDQGRHLLLLVDGLDEDQHPENSIASALPGTLPAGVKVTVASRTMPYLNVPNGHPLADEEYRHPLAPARKAGVQKAEAFSS